jgi:hypothetical protein
MDLQAANVDPELGINNAAAQVSQVIVALPSILATPPP